MGVETRIARVDGAAESLEAEEHEISRAGELTAAKTGSEATSSAATPALVASAQTAWPVATPSAVKTPLRRPPTSVLLIVSAVSGPGVTITSKDTARKAASIRGAAASREDREP